MENISQHIAFINAQIAFHEKKASQFKDEEWRRNIHSNTAEKLRSVLQTLTELALRDQAHSLQKPKAITGQQLSLTLEDIQDLPQELLSELSISEGDRTEFAIVNLINQAGGVLSLDKILIGLYKETGEIHKRQNLTNRLYRMSQKGLIYSVPNKKGAYSTQEISPEQVEQLSTPKQ